MAKTAASAFDEFNKKIQLTNAQQGEVKQRRDAASKFVMGRFPSTSDLEVVRVRLIGSAARGTAIRPLDDVDVLAEFKDKGNIFAKYRSDSSAFLHHVTRVLRGETTRVEEIGSRGQAVRLFYKHGPHVDIAPVFKWDNTNGYGLPAGDGKWLTTDPFAQAAWADEKQKALDNYYKRRVRFLRRWNNVHSGRLKSYHLEVMVGAIFTSMNNDSRDCLMKFFEWAPRYLNVNDPAGHSGSLSQSYTANTRKDILNSFATELVRTRKANQAELDGNHKEAIRLWGITLGKEFPTYG